MTKITTVYLTRHGETKWNVEGKLQGHKDSPLTNLGKRQAQWLGVSLKDIKFDAIYSSASPRAIHTAEIIRDKREVTVSSCESLMEINMGSWEGEKRSEIEREFHDEHKTFWSAPHSYIPTNGGENFFQLQDRLIPQVEEIISKHPGGNVLVVTHAIALKVIMAYFKEESLEKLWTPPIIQPTALNKVVKEEGKFNIELHGDVSHFVNTIWFVTLLPMGILRT
ncbi:histidine phosphatase family protein [Paenibacillus sp. CF384]|uniref:histidine phosphatase family protein n=1 Tax=Paenibacillus sp. CF384 TaxID=1884382 RepID=UPI0008941EC5|nr:histidine phosphatase family protein [Paenibacillus sp. CF384]SDW22814.1 phosphoglycerate mutase [Paenibacillus sp. CF384]